MNIRDIAKAAGVSPATVSRVLNHQEEKLSAETCSRVQRIIREMNYSPFAARECKTPSRLLGILLDGGRNSAPLLNGIESAARKEGYGVLVQFRHDGDSDGALLSLLRSRHADGIICQEGCALGEDTTEFPLCRIGTPSGPSFDIAGCAALLTEKLLSAGHTRIVCVTETDSGSPSFSAGYQKAMRDGGLAAEPPLEITDSLLPAKLYHCTAALCQTYASARRLGALLAGMNIRVPDSFSIVCMTHDTEEEDAGFPVSGCRLSERALGMMAACRLMEQLEGRRIDCDCPGLVSFRDCGSVASPNVRHIPSILVVGSINMDTLLRLPDFPDCGRTHTVLTRTVMPGGKGLNQAVGCRKLGADVALLGRLGRDFEGTTLYSYLQEKGVKMTGVQMDAADTGYACVTIDRDGESNILIDRGANARLTCDDVRSSEQLFEGVGFCLLQTELPVEIALESARLARKHGAKVILKPCNKPTLPDELLSLTDYLIPNRHELSDLCPGEGTPEAKARSLLARGCGCVIVTMGHNGCMMVTADECRAFPAAKVRVVDTTGACDAFAAALAVFLLRGETAERAIRYANCAAGLSCQQLGVSPSLPDLATVRQFAGAGS